MPLQLPSLPASIRSHRTAIIAVGVATVVTLTPIFYLRRKHFLLRQRVHHHEHSLLVRDLSSAVSSLDIKSIPTTEPTEPHGDCMIFHDRCSMNIPKSLLPPYIDLDEMLEVYLRRNMSEFAKYPGAKIMKRQFKQYPEVVKSFDQDFIKELKFEVGDWVCGYQVFYRDGAEVELGISMVPQRYDEEKEIWMGEGEYKGRLCFSLTETTGKRMNNGFMEGEVEEGLVEFMTTTVMYKDEAQKAVMIMERRIPRFMHEMGSWGLLTSGTDYLIDLARKQRAVEH